VVIPFGRHKGWLLAELPDGYLEWLRSLSDLREPLRSACDREWRRRHAGYEPPPRPKYEEPGALRVPGKDQEMFRELVEAGYRQMCLRHHPDVGGKPENMRQLLSLMEALRKQLGKN
jgi:hypothetical protein